jgi:regulator of replication initiation timing
MERGLDEDARVLAWVRESQQVLQHLLPALLRERDALDRQLQEVTRRCQALQAENEGLRARLYGHADLLDSVGQFVNQMSHMLEPMRTLAEKIGQAGHHRDGVDRVG